MNFCEIMLLLNRDTLTTQVVQWITLKICQVSDSSNSQFLEKMQKLIHKLLKSFANCELQTANSNIVPIKKKHGKLMKSKHLKIK